MVCMTLKCVGLTQSSVIQIIHRNVGLKCFFYLLKFLLLSLVFVIDVKNIYLQIKYIKHAFYTFIKYIIKYIIKTSNCRCFQLPLFTLGILCFM